MRDNKIMIIIIIIAILIIVGATIGILAYVNRKNNTNQDQLLTEQIIDSQNDIVEPAPEKASEEFVEVSEDGVRVNISQKLKESKIVGDLKFDNIQLTYQNEQTILLSNVKNEGQTATEEQYFKIIMLDKSGQELGTVNGMVGELNPGEERQFNVSTQLDYSNIYDFNLIKE